MRDYLLTSFVIGSLPICLFRPYYGLLLYAWLSYMYPQSMAWSLGQSLPFAKSVAIATVLGTVLNGVGDLSPLRRRETVLMICLWSVFTFSTIFAINPNEAWPEWQDVSKLIIMALLGSTFLTDRKRMRYFLLVVAISLGFHGFKAGIFSLTTRGENMVFGPGSSILENNNNIGLALNMCLPLLWYVGREERGYIRTILYEFFGLTIPAIMFTYSRASALTLPVVLLAIVVRGRNPLIPVALLVFVAVLAFPFIPQKFWERQETVIDYQADTSAMSRIDNWKFCWRVALDRPLTGAGFKFFTPEMVAVYSPEFLLTYGKTWDTHNIYFAMLGSHGFPGLLLFVSMIGFSLLSCIQISRTIRDHPDLSWVRSYSRMVEVSFLALLLNGVFVNMEYFELVYHLVAIVVCLKVICHRVSSSSAERVEFTKEALAVPS